MNDRIREEPCMAECHWEHKHCQHCEEVSQIQSDTLEEVEEKIKTLEDDKVDIVNLKAEGIEDLHSWAEGYSFAIKKILKTLKDKGSKT